MIKKERKIMEEANKLIKKKRIDYDTEKKELIWIWYPKVFKALIDETVDYK